MQILRQRAGKVNLLCGQWSPPGGAWGWKAGEVTERFYSYPRKRGFPGGTSGKEATCQCRRHKRCRFDPWVWKIPWRRKWQPTPVFLPGESRGPGSLAGYSLWGLSVHAHSTVGECGYLVIGMPWGRTLVSSSPSALKTESHGGQDVEPCTNQGAQDAVSPTRPRHRYAWKQGSGTLTA